jgi:hypothetical protein
MSQVLAPSEACAACPRALQLSSWCFKAALVFAAFCFTAWIKPVSKPLPCRKFGFFVELPIFF